MAENEERYPNRVSRVQYPGSEEVAAATPSIRSATFRGADGGGRPQASRDAAYKARENVLLRGLPERTSPFARRLAKRNARVGTDTREFSKSGGYGARSSEVGDARVKALNKQYAGEDSNYTQGYQALTGRQDAGQLAERRMANRLANTGAQNQGRLEEGAQRGDAAYRLASEVTGPDAYNREALAQSAKSEREFGRQDQAEREFQARYGPGGTEREAADRQQEAYGTARDAQALATTKASLAEQLLPLSNGDGDLMDDTLAQMPKEILNEKDPAKQLTLARRFMINKAMETGGALRQSDPYLESLDQPVGEGGLAGATYKREGTWMDEILKRGSSFLPGTNYGVGKGDSVYSGAGGQTIIGNNARLSQAQRQFNRQDRLRPRDE